MELRRKLRNGLAQGVRFGGYGGGKCWCDPGVLRIYERLG
jgi:hypothetical protein